MCLALRDQQELFWRLITAPEGPSTAGLPVDALERVNVYAEAYFWRIHDALAEDFPKLRAAAGSERWHNLITDYVAERPSQSPSLTWMGARLAAFLRARAEHELADLAELEWARAEVFLAADATPIGVDALRGIDPERFAVARFQLIPALRVLRLAARSVRVWREGFTVYNRDISSAEADALDLARAGRTLAEVCSPFSTPDDAFAALSSWVHDGVVAALLG